jgi:hypothetical protein
MLGLILQNDVDYILQPFPHLYFTDWLTGKAVFPDIDIKFFVSMLLLYEVYSVSYTSFHVATWFGKVSFS